MKNPSIKNFIIVLTTLFFFSILFIVPAKSLDLPKLKNPLDLLKKNPLDLLKKKKTDTGGAKFNMKNNVVNTIMKFLMDGFFIYFIFFALSF